MRAESNQKDFVSGKVIARHGGVICKPDHTSLVSRVGDVKLSSLYDGYILHLLPLAKHSIFDAITTAIGSRGKLVILIDPLADELLFQLSLPIPHNLRTVYSLTGIKVDTHADGEELLRKLITRHTDAFIYSGGFNRWETGRFHRIVERAVRSKSSLDDWFYHVPYGVTTIHHRAVEMRKGRAVIGLDFNSMYASTFGEQNYPHPARLQYSDNSKKLIQGCLDGKMAGAFICRVSDADPLMTRCLMLTESFGHFSVQTKLPESFVVILHANEIQLWDPYARIEVLEGVYSSVMIEHPLNALAHKIYDFRQQAIGVSKKIAKHELLLMHSCTANHTSTTISPKEAIRDYGYREQDLMFADDVVVPSIGNPANIYCLQRQVLANARVKLWKTILMLDVAMPDAELCYANVDSLHYSLPEGNSKAFKALLPIGNGLGQLKVEFEGSEGLWLDPGRWWIKKSDALVTFRSGSQRISPDFSKMNLHLDYKKVDSGRYDVMRLDSRENAASMARFLARNTKNSIRVAKQLWRRFSVGIELQ